MARLLVSLMALFLILPAAGTCQDHFVRWDANGDGLVTLQEFPYGVGNFRRMDTNGDNIVTRLEYNRFFGIQTPETPEPPVAPPPVAPPPQASQEEARLRSRVQALEAENAKLSKELEKFRNENFGMAQENQGLRGQVGQLQKQVAQLQSQIAQLEQQVRQLNERLSSRPSQPQPYPPTQPTQPVQPKPPVVQPGDEGYPRPPENAAADWLMAEETGYRDALRNLASRIRGSWIAACSSSVDGQSHLVVVGQLDPTQLVGVQRLEAQYDFRGGVVTVPIEITRANIIESIRRTNKGMTPDEFQELRIMFPEKVGSYGRGSWTPQGQAQLLAFYGAQMDARRKLVEQLRGVMIRSSSRMENFVVTKHQVVASIETTLLIGVHGVDEKLRGEIAEATIEISRPMFIYSMRRGLEANGLTLTPEEYQNFRNMLSEETYRITGRAAVQR